MSQDKKWFYKSFWLEEDKVAFLEIIGDFDDKGMIEFNQHMRDEYLEKGQAPVHCIIDAAGLSGYPRNLKALRSGTSISANHPKMGWVLLIGFENAMLGFLATTISQLLGLKFKQVRSLAEARDVLRRIDDRLKQENV